MQTLLATLSVDLVRSLIVEFLHPKDISILYRTCRQFRKYFQKQIEEIKQALDEREVTIVKEKTFDYKYKADSYQVSNINNQRLPFNYVITGKVVSITVSDDVIKEKLLEKIEKFHHLKLNRESVKVSEHYFITHNCNIKLWDILTKNEAKHWYRCDSNLCTCDTFVHLLQCQREIKRVFYRDFLIEYGIERIHIKVENPNEADLQSKIMNLLEKNKRYHSWA